MSNFEVKIQPIFVKPHPNADRLDLCNVGSPEGWQVVVAKGRFQSGDMCAYIGENAVVPENILKFYGYWNEEQNKGMLAGSKGDRVKAIRLRNEFSLGIVLQLETHKQGWYRLPHTDEGTQSGYVQEGDEVSEYLGVTKYEPPVPVHMAGEVYNVGTHIGVNYDIENIKKFPDVFDAFDVDGDDPLNVQVTEKLHGTFCQICVMPFTPEYHNDDHFVVTNNNSGAKAYIAVSSKGLGGQGLFLKNNERNENNVYVRTARRYFENLTRWLVNSPFTVCGEVFGNGVQDLTYGYSQGVTDFRVFDVYEGRRGAGIWLSDATLEMWCQNHEIPRVPILYRGPYSRALIDEMTQKTKSVFDPKQIREGVVIKPVHERRHPVLGRVALKSINEDYLTRKNGTEFN